MSDGRRIVSRLAPIAAVVALAVAWLVPTQGWVRLAWPTADAPVRMAAVLDALPDDPVVLVGFDPDFGTYAEVRPTARALVADLLARDARLAFVSLTAEGRALASAELARLLRAEANAARLVDLGFMAGAEAGLVDLTRGLPPARPGTVPTAGGDALARQLADEGMAAVTAVAVIGGNDLGPRSWLEQVVPRVDGLAILSVTPTVLLPEVQPYVSSGQLAAALTTPQEGAAYRASLELGNLDRLVESDGLRELPILVGMLIAVLVLAQAAGARLSTAMGAARGREAR
jgi:hypothetical protein